MKKLILIVLLFSPLFSIGQQTEKLVDTTKLWSHLYMTPSLGGPPPHTMITDYIKFSSDTLASFNHYKKVLIASDSNHISWSLIGLIREDTTGKVYYKGLQDMSERLFYNFNAQVGDTVLIINNLNFKMVVDSIDSVYIYDKFRKRLIFQTQEMWIEGIGSFCGILQSGRSFIVGTSDYLLCYYENANLEYNNPNYLNCYYNNVGVPEFEKNKKRITISPNPFSTSTAISFDKTYQTLDLSIIDLQGKIIQQKFYHDSNKINLDRAGIATGFYFLRVSLDGKYVETKKVVVAD